MTVRTGTHRYGITGLRASSAILVRLKRERFALDDRTYMWPRGATQPLPIVSTYDDRELVDAYVSA